MKWRRGLGKNNFNRADAGNDATEKLIRHCRNSNNGD